jgi:poly(3-hydroxybutyrate) depolymerase
MPEFAQERHFSVRVPADYDPDRAYRVVYLGQGCGSDNKSAFQNTYTLYKEDQGGTEQAIYVAVSLPDENLKSSMNGRCYDNRAGEAAIEWEAFQAIHTFVDTNYCVDNNRVYVAGYSTGGWLANMWGCYFAGLDPSRKFAGNYSIRGQAAVTGGLPLVPDCGGSVAAIWIHDQFDMANEIAGNFQARDRVLAVNGCAGSASEPWGEGEQLSQIDCQRYVDCPEEYPVIFCTSTESGHSDQYARAVPAFTQFFALMDP